MSSGHFPPIILSVSWTWLGWKPANPNRPLFSTPCQTGVTSPALRPSSGGYWDLKLQTSRLYSKCPSLLGLPHSSFSHTLLFLDLQIILCMYMYVACVCLRVYVFVSRHMFSCAWRLEIDIGYLSLLLSNLYTETGLFLFSELRGLAASIVWLASLPLGSSLVASQGLLAFPLQVVQIWVLTHFPCLRFYPFGHLSPIFFFLKKSVM